MECAESKMLASSTRNIGGKKKVGIRLLMNLLVDANGSLMNFLDSMRKQKDRRDDPLIVSYTFALSMWWLTSKTKGRSWVPKIRSQSIIHMISP